jgi:hypothetical protein
MDVLAKPKIKPIKRMSFSWHSNILGSMMRLE